MEELAKKIKRGISPEVALKTTGNKYGETISVPTLYLRIDRKKMKCSNLDLRNKVKRQSQRRKRGKKGENILCKPICLIRKRNDRKSA